MKLDLMEGREHPVDAHFPEDWIGSTTRAANKGREHLAEEGLSKVTVADETLTLKALCEKQPNALLGAGHVEKYCANTQFLLKFLDSAIRLHIQCHPTIPFAQKHLNRNSGKTEAYIILSIRNDVKDCYVKEADVFYIGIVSKGSGTIVAGDETYPVNEGSKFFVPYQTGPVTFESESSMEITATFPPE